LGIAVPFSAVVTSAGRRNFEFTNTSNVSGKKPSVEIDVTVMAMMHTAGVLDTSIDFLASPLPW
jgi:hypothetical protein